MTSKRLLMLVGDFVEDYEAMVPYQMLVMVGHEVDVVCPGKVAGESVATAIQHAERRRRPLARPSDNVTGHLRAQQLWLRTGL